MSGGDRLGTLAVIGHGFIGGRITRHALEQGWKVRTLGRREIGPCTEPGHEHVVGDARHADVVRAVVEGADHVVFAASTSKPADSGRHPMRKIAANLSPLLSVLKALPGTSVTGLTLLSSGGTVYGPDAPTPTPESAPLWPISAYGVLNVTSERYAWMHAREHGCPVDVLRCANVYGPGEPTEGSQGLIGITRAALRAGRPVVVYGDGSARRDFVHVDDVAAAVIALAGRPNGFRVLNLGSGTSVSVHEVIEAVADSLSTTARLEHRPARPTDVPVVQLDVTALRRLIAFSPRDLRSGLTDGGV